jgi:adenylylsulfate kinase
MSARDGVVVWITGRPASGKSTLGARAHEALRDRGRSACLLDGDEVRALMVPPPGYSPADRDAFYATLSGLAAVLARQGLAVVVAATAHLAKYREEARRAAPRFVEVYVAADASTCAARDPKGLYARARSGAVHDLPGVDVAYEEPYSPDVVATGGHDEAAVAAILARVVQ